jgi:DNA-directed RNA polymerases I and III subunit RPAC1
MPSLEQHELRTRVILHEDRISGVSSTEFPHTWPNEDLSYSLEKFTENLRIVKCLEEDMTLEFDLIGVHASIANALRRIIICEVPTMAIEMVYYQNNTSIVADEILAQRLGLVPIKADARMFEFREGSADPPTDLNTRIIKLT